ncbi:hypothetical protein B484DRAFT_481104 [Ochromonadaceae sp. CCMP2298]|nr:hypothetical protein B484DRAFT_481104 [Ochromonadaceae sp. CCMP2298]
MMNVDFGVGVDAKVFNLTDFRMNTTDDDSSVLLANTNKLLSAVGISAKKIISTDELSRVASSLFVAVFESLFHQKIEGVIRNPQTKDEYERNAQLVVDSLSDQIQLDLKHITGGSIVSGDVRVLSNLVHILVRIVSLTSQESLTSYDSDEFPGGTRHPVALDVKYREAFQDVGGAGNDNDSISTRNSTFVATDRSGQPAFNMGGEPLVEAPGGMVFNEDLRRSIAKAEKYLQYEKKLDAARKRRESMQFLKESRSRTANQRQTEVSRNALQQRWLTDAEMSRRSHALKRSSEDQVLLRKIYSGLLKRVMKWRIEEAREEKVKKEQTREQTNWQVESIQNLFEERLRALACDDAGVDKSSRAREERDELTRAKDLYRSITAKNSELLEKEKLNLQQKRARELLRRQDARKNLLAMLGVDKWQDMLRLSLSNE